MTLGFHRSITENQTLLPLLLRSFKFSLVEIEVASRVAVGMHDMARKKHTHCNIIFSRQEAVVNLYKSDGENEAVGRVP